MEIRGSLLCQGQRQGFFLFCLWGGSSMGYKLAGYDVIGCNEIDPRMAELYKDNLHPKYCYIEPIQDFKLREDFPKELYNLDILDGSPPCSTFSMAGSREMAWGKAKKFREGQAKQVLDTLFFDFIDLARELQPKVVIAENVKGLLLGKAKEYTSRILSELGEAGYVAQYKLLDAMTMGVPQRRERVFFFALRKDLASKVAHTYDVFGNALPYPLPLDFDERPILFGEINDGGGKTTYPMYAEMWKYHKKYDSDLASACIRKLGKRKYFTVRLAYDDLVCPTIASKHETIIHHEAPTELSVNELVKCSSFPSDYDFGKQDPYYVCGMSVPPVMMANIATRIYDNWISKF